MSATYAHFVGVGGAGMSALALVLHARGVRVTGSDLKESRYSRMLASAGVDVEIGHAAKNVGDAGIVVLSSAIPDSNPEVMAARERGIAVWPRARMLAHLAGSDRTIAVAGTHGKTTTSSMIATMLCRMELDPTFLVGGEVDGFGTNARSGSGDLYVVEADESDGSFVHLDPHVALVTNVEKDHVDHYTSLDQVEETFVEFMGRTASDGFLVVCADDARLCELARGCGKTVVTYGFSDTADVRCVSTRRDGNGHFFEVRIGEREISCRTGIPGLHMVSNATGALAVAHVLGLDTQTAASALAGFSGVRRRFDVVGEVHGVTVVDDYAHHPTEVLATLSGAAELGHRAVWAVFQPHRYSRTAAFARDFGSAFRDADRVVIMDVYSAGETPIPGVGGMSLVRSILDVAPRSHVAYLPHRRDVVPFVSSRVSKGDLVLTMGAGDVTSLGPEIVAALERERTPRESA